MYNKKLLLFTAISIALLAIANMQIRAEIPIVQADTVFAGFGGGSVSGIVFGPDGNTVILMHNANPIEIDIKTHKVLREFEKVPNASGAGENFKFIKGYNYLSGTFSSSEINGIKNFAGTIIWDEATGKIVKALSKNYFVVGDNQIFNWISGKNYFYKFDLNSFKEIDSMFIDPNLDGDGSSEWCRPAVIPNSNKVLFGVNRYIENESGDKTYLLGELYLLDFDTKKYSKINIPYESGQKSSEIWSISVSQSGMYNMLVMRYISNGEINYLFYDKNMNYLFKENSKSLSAQLGITNLGIGYYNLFIDDNNLVIPCSRLSVRNELIYSLPEKRIKSVIDFFGGDRVSFNNDEIALINQNGVVGLVNKIQVPVKENPVETNNVLSVRFQDGYLIINSSMQEQTDIELTNYNGNLLFIQKNVILHSGENKVKITIPLESGVYFCLIKSSTDSISFKFMVSK